jgi:hypothetical protein
LVTVSGPNFNGTRIVTGRKNTSAAVTRTSVGLVVGIGQIEAVTPGRKEIVRKSWSFAE